MGGLRKTQNGGEKALFRERFEGERAILAEKSVGRSDERLVGRVKKSASDVGRRPEGREAVGTERGEASGGPGPVLRDEPLVPQRARRARH